MPASVVTILATVLKIAAGLGWFSESHWPSEVDEAIDALEEAEGRELPGLREKRAYAYEMMLKHHHAEPWNKPWRLKKFQDAIKDLAKAIEEEANRFKAEKEAEVGVLPTLLDKLKKYAPYIALGGAGIFTVILVWKASKVR